MFLLNGSICADPWLFFQMKYGLFADGDGDGDGGGDGAGTGGDGGAGGEGGDGGTGDGAGDGDGGIGDGDAAAAAARKAQLAGGDGDGDKVPTLDKWHASIEDADDRKYAEQYDTPAALSKAARGLRQQLSKAVVVPVEGASDEDVAKFRKSIGVPETADAYEIPLPEYAQKAAEKEDAPIHASLTHYKTAAHQANLTPAQMQVMSKAYFDLEQGQIAAVFEADKAFAEATEKELRVTWPGEQYERNKTISNRFGETAVKEGALTQNELDSMRAMETKDGRFVLDHPVFLKAFNFAMRSRTEDQPGSMFMDEGERATSTKTLEEKRQEVRDLTRKGKVKEALAAQEVVDTMDKQLHGTGDLVGVAGRTV